jgi:hypothetical protein
LAGVDVVEVVPETVVVVNWHGCQFTAVLVVVPPVTVAVRVVDCPTMIVVPTEDVTETVTAFVLLLLLPQPAARHAAAIAEATHVRIVRNFIPLPPKQTRHAGMCARSVT